MTNSSCRIRHLRSWWWHIGGDIGVELIEVATDYRRWASVIGIEGVDKTESNNESIKTKARAVACLPAMLRNCCSIEMRLTASRAVVDEVLQELTESAQLRAERFNSAE